jgi:hypothetical protein
MNYEGVEDFSLLIEKKKIKNNDNDNNKGFTQMYFNKLIAETEDSQRTVNHKSFQPSSNTNNSKLLPLVENEDSNISKLIEASPIRDITREYAAAVLDLFRDESDPIQKSIDYIISDKLNMENEREFMTPESNSEIKNNDSDIESNISKLIDIFPDINHKHVVDLLVSFSNKPDPLQRCIDYFLNHQSELRKGRF